MFFQKELQHRVQLSPEYFGPGLLDEVERRLRSEVEGTCHGRYGFIICVLSVDRVSRGLVQDSYGYASFDITYKAIVLKPFKGQVMDAVVASVNKMGFFADVGPLHVFVSSHLIPADMKFDPAANPPCFLSEDQTQRIATGDLVRLKIVGIRMDASDIFAIGTIKEDYMGWIG